MAVGWRVGAMLRGAVVSSMTPLIWLSIMDSFRTASSLTHSCGFSGGEETRRWWGNFVKRAESCPE